MKKKLLGSVSAVLLAAAIIGGASFADFSSQAASAENSFTAGSLKLELTGSNPTGAAQSGWKSPANWVPGQEVTGYLDLKDIGNVDAKHVYFRFTDLTHTGTANLFDKIIITDVHEIFNGVSTGKQLQTLKQHIGIPASTDLTLAELVSHNYYSWDDKSGDNIILNANSNTSDYRVSFTFKFKEDAGNEYQGTTATFNLLVDITQNSPTEGYIALHQ